MSNKLQLNFNEKVSLPINITHSSRLPIKIIVKFKNQQDKNDNGTLAITNKPRNNSESNCVNFLHAVLSQLYQN